MHARVRGEGPVPCSVLVLGDMPGYEEAKSGRPFTGRAGRELRRHFNGWRVPLTDADVYFSNLSKTPAKDVKSMTFTARDEAELWDEIDMLEPRWIVTCGARVTHYFLGDDVTLEMVHGIPHQPEQWAAKFIDRAKAFCNTVPMIFPTYNPAAALHVPALQTIFAHDLENFGLALTGKLPAAARDEKPGQYGLLADGETLPLILGGEIGLDTEGWIHNPWGLSYSTIPYTGRVIRKGSPAIARLFNAIKFRGDRVTLHNSLHDIGVIRALGCDLEEMGIPIDDTMIMAYLLGLEPQGLKPLAYRHAGMTHDDYSDVVAEPNARIAFEWLMEIYDRLPDTPEKLTKTRIKKGEVQIVLSPEEVPLAKAKKLIERMLGKEEGNPLRKRWADSRSREILAEEAGFLGIYDADPPEATLDEIPLDVAVTYAGRDADATVRIAPHLRKQIEAYNLTDVYETDIAVVPMIERMQTVGLGCDVEHFKALSLMLDVDEQINREDIRRTLGRDLNANSGDQVAELLFDEMQLHLKAPNLKMKKTEGGERYSTNDKILEALEDVDPTGIVKLITDGREIKKIKRSYADPIPRLLRADGRLHPQYRITRTDTGRLSAANPNVLAFPKHSKRGKLVRDGFVAGPGRELGEWDFDQIEMRVFAHDSGDVRMISEFWSGLDKHASTAAMMYNRPVEDVIAEYKGGFGEGEHERFTAKAVNFGVLMGITEFGLKDQFHKAGQLDWIEYHDDVEAMPKQTRRLLAQWYDSYPDGYDYIFKKHAEARKYGYVRDMWGRMRWLEGIHAADEWIRREAERQAQATPTQSGAQGIVKRSMRALWPILQDFRRRGIWVECLLQIHDALVLEYDEQHRDLIDSTVLAVMHTCVELAVPVTAKAKFGLRLGAL